MRLTNPLWYLAALLIALTSLVGAAAVAAGGWDPVRDATVVSAAQPLAADGRTVAVFTDIVQPERDVTCGVVPVPAEGADEDAEPEPVEVPPSTIDLLVDDDGNQWHLIGLLRQAPDGEVSVACSPADDRVDDATYGVAAVTGVESRFGAGRLIAIVGPVTGAILAGFVLFSRRMQRREVRSEA